MLWYSADGSYHPSGVHQLHPPSRSESILKNVSDDICHPNRYHNWRVHIITASAVWWFFFFFGSYMLIIIIYISPPLLGVSLLQHVNSVQFPSIIPIFMPYYSEVSSQCQLTSGNDVTPIHGPATSARLSLSLVSQLFHPLQVSILVLGSLLGSSSNMWLERRISLGGAWVSLIFVVGSAMDSGTVISIMMILFLLQMSNVFI